MNPERPVGLRPQFPRFYHVIGSAKDTGTTASTSGVIEWRKAEQNFSEIFFLARTYQPGSTSWQTTPTTHCE